MDAKKDYNLLSDIMRNANMGWWEADVQDASYICSEYIANLLGLKEDGYISFEDFNKRILKEEQPHTTSHSFYNMQQMNEAVYLLDSVKGPVWVRSKACMQKTDEKGHTKIYGIAEIQDGPYMSSASQVLQQRERLLHNIYKNLPVGIELYNIDGVLIDLNDKELEMFHLRRKEDLLGVNIFDNPVFPQEMKEKLRKYENADFTFRYDFAQVGSYYDPQTKTGTIDLVTKVTTLYDEKHVPTNYLLINADKTETTVAYNKIQEFESFFELIGNYAKVGYAHYNLLTRQGYAQHSWYINVGEQEDTPLSEIIGVYNHIHPDDRHDMLRFLDNALKGTENKFNKEIRILRQDGNCSWTHVNLIVKVYAPERNCIELICINYDITRLKDTEAMLILAKEKAEESDRLKSAFLANMSHEIRTPLNAIVGFSDLLSDTSGFTSEEIAQFIGTINKNCGLLLALINDILDLSRIESGTMEFMFAEHNLPLLLKTVHDSQRLNMPPGVELVLRMPESDKKYLTTDNVRLQQVVNNLINNAAKFTSSGFITFGYEDDEVPGYTRIFVEDTGVGISEEGIRHIFERFYKVDNFTQGAGLGLSICQTIIERLNGTISVTSEVGKGTRFTVRLPNYCE